MIINVKYINNVDRGTAQIDDSTIIKNFMEEKGFSYTSADALLDGAALMPGDINKSFAEFGCTGNVNLTQIKKADNAR